MSSIARWSYANVATVRPYLGENGETGKREYGAEYEIACCWTAENLQEVDRGGASGSRGDEFITQHIIYTEDKRPGYMDQIMFEGSNGWETVRKKTGWDMSMFGEAGSPDFKLVT